MFGKLLKNDLKAQWHSMSTIFLCVMVVALVAEGFTIFAKNKVLGALGGILVMLCLLIACVIIVIAVGMMFSKTMFSRAGYLTLSLPVKTSSLVWSKTISGLIWIFTVYALFVASMFLWVHQAQKILGEETLNSVESLLQLFGAPSFQSIFVFVITFLISFAISVLLVVQCMYLGVTCSHCAPISKLGVIGAVIIFFVSFGIIQGVTNQISNLLPMGFVISPETVKLTSNVAKTAANAVGNVQKVTVTGPILRLICSILLHFPIVYLTKNKVNIK